MFEFPNLRNLNFLLQKQTHTLKHGTTICRVCRPLQCLTWNLVLVLALLVQFNLFAHSVLLGDIKLLVPLLRCVWDFLAIVSDGLYFVVHCSLFMSLNVLGSSAFITVHEHLWSVCTSLCCLPQVFTAFDKKNWHILGCAAIIHFNPSFRLWSERWSILLKFDLKL